MLKLLSLFINTFTYLNNTEFIQNHNHQNLSFDVEENQFINQTYENEFNINTHPIEILKHEYFIEDYDYDKYEKSIDWRERNKVSSVKNQGDCGSCWSFSAVGAIESLWAIHKNQLYNLSEQELIDCSGRYGNKGCQGGSMDGAFQYVIDNGLCSNISYPYLGEQSLCDKDNCETLVKISNYSDIIQNNEKILEKVLHQQPISVAIQANKRSFQFYKSGIYSDPDCGEQLDHGVLLVGYGYDKKYDMKYWIVKNSWSSSWGENGYIRIQKDIQDPRGLCGIAMTPSIPLL